MVAVCEWPQWCTNVHTVYSRLVTQTKSINKCSNQYILAIWSNLPLFSNMIAPYSAHCSTVVLVYGTWNLSGVLVLYQLTRTIRTKIIRKSACTYVRTSSCAEFMSIACSNKCSQGRRGNGSDHCLIKRHLATLKVEDLALPPVKKIAY